MAQKKAMRIAYGEALARLGKQNEKVVVFDADLSHATMTCTFASKFPNRFFNAGIAEANMTGMAAGMASMGYIPFMSTFAVFGAGRAYEQIRNAVCYSEFPVVIACTHGGITAGEDGGSHQAIEDIALMRELPNMTVLVPCDPIELEKAVFAAADYGRPVYLRIGRWPFPTVTDENTPFEIGKANVLKEGTSATIFATGIMVPKAMEAASILEQEGITVNVIDVHTIKPLDRECVLKYGLSTGRVVTAEEHSVIGGLGDAVADVLIGNPLKFRKIGIQDKFGQSGAPDEMMEEYGLTAPYLVDAVKQMID